MNGLSPKLALDFSTATLDNRIAFTRAGSTATQVNANGLIESVAAGTPRFSYNPLTLVCNGLLIEETRENYILHSDDYSQTAWNGSGTQTYTANATIAPDGTQTAMLVQSLTGSGVSQAVFAKSNTPVFSIYAKKFTGATVFRRFLFRNNTTSVNLVGIDFNYDTGTFVYTHGSSGASVVNAGNGWWRIIIAPTSGVTSGNIIRLYAGSSGGSAVGDGAYFWRAQVEDGGFATSPTSATTTTALTRNADVATITGTNFSDWWQATRGGVLVRARPGTVSGIRPWVQFDDNTADNIIALRGNTTNPELYVRAGGGDQATLDAGTIAANTVYDLDGSWNSNDCRLRLNNGSMVATLLPTIPTVTQMRIGSDGTNYLNGHLEKIDYFDQIYLPGSSFLPTVFI